VSDVRKECWDPRDGQCSERRLMRSMEHEGYEVTSYVYAPGTVFPWHEHNADKCDAVVSGALRIEIAGGDVFDLEPGDRLYLPGGTRHRAEVIGTQAVLSLDGTRW
jgi:quercetin dioxygenase-like cupin family protein